MNRLTKAAWDMFKVAVPRLPGEEISIGELKAQADADNEFSLLLAYSSSSDIRAMLDELLADEQIVDGLSIWAILLSYRLVCLLEPENAEIRRRAAFYLRLFGPDWDNEADKLDEEAEMLEKQKPSN